MCLCAESARRACARAPWPHRAAFPRSPRRYAFCTLTEERLIKFVLEQIEGDKYGYGRQGSALSRAELLEHIALIVSEAEQVG